MATFLICPVQMPPHTSTTDAHNIGPYRTLGLLGEGGMGTVYLAQHTQTLATVALKTIPVPSARMIQGLRREIHALMQLHHPNIVTIVDDGVDDKRAWYAMERLDGRAWREHLQGKSVFETPGQATQTWTWNLTDHVLDASQIPMPLLPSSKRVFEGATDVHLKYAAQVVQGLAHMHSHGIVHCDLKPDNVLITESGQAVVVDFGLAVARSRRVQVEEVNTAGVVAGTALYISPERLKGDDFDARADFYALGCILYEIVTGHAPFHGCGDLVHAHMHQTPALPSTFVCNIPPALEELIVGLLAKNPRDRPAQCQFILHVLSEYTAAVDAPLPLVYVPRFVGHHETLETLKGSFLSGAKSDNWMLVGESGVGKTRLALEFVRRIRTSDVHVATAQAHEDATPLHLFSQLVQSVVDEARTLPKASNAWLEPAAVLLPFIPALRAVPGVEAWLEPVPLPPEEAEPRIVNGLMHMLKAFEGRKVVFVVDDIQWSDALSLRAFERLLVRCQEQPWTVLCLSRSGVPFAQGEQWCARDLLKMQTVLRLDNAAIQVLVSDMLGTSRPPQSLIAFVDAHAGGNPRFAVECVYTAVEQQVIALDPQGQWVTNSAHEQAGRLGLPQTLRELLDVRFQFLPEHERALCEIIHALGDCTDTARIGAVAAISDSACNAVLVELEHRGIVKELYREPLQFFHEHLAQVVAEHLAKDLARRKLLYLACAQALVSDQPSSAALRRQGWLWKQCGERAKARQAYFQAAKRAVETHAFNDADKLYGEALSLCASDDPMALQGRLAWVEHVLLLKGKTDKAKQVLTEAKMLATDAIDRVRLGRLHGQVHCISAYESDVFEILHDAVQLAASINRPNAQARCLETLAAVYEIHGDLKRALHTLQDALELHRGCNAADGVGRTLRSIGGIHRSAGRFDEANRVLLEALSAVNGRNDRVEEAILHHEIGGIQMLIGENTHAFKRYNKALSIVLEIGYYPLEGRIINNIASVYLRQKRYMLSLQAARYALLIHQEVGNQHLVCVSLGIVGSALSETGHFDEAREAIEQARSIQHTQGWRSREALSMSNLGYIASQQKQHTEALAFYHSALAIHRDIGDRYREGTMLYSVGCNLRDLGRFEDAEDAFDTSMSILCEVEAKYDISMALGELALLYRYQGRFAESKSSLAEVKVSEVAQSPYVQIMVMSEEASLEFAQQHDASEYVARIQAFVAEHGMAHLLAVQTVLDGLMRAQKAYQEGALLLAGDHPDCLPDAVRERLLSALKGTG